MKSWIVDAARILLSRRQLLAPLGVILGTIVTLDFIFRVYVARNDELRKFVAPKQVNFPTAERSSAIKFKLEAVFPPPPTPDELAAAAPREVVLQGVFVLGEVRTAALALLPQGDKPLERYNLRVGGEIDGWTVQRIKHSAVTLRKGGESKELLMFRTRL